MDGRVYQLQKFDRIGVECDSHGRISKESYELGERCIACFEIKESAKGLDDMAIISDAWHACNADCWGGRKKEGGPVDTNYLTTHLTDFSEGYCGSDVYVILGDRIYVADCAGWTRVLSVKEAWWRIIFFNTFISWDEIRNQLHFDIMGFDKYVEEYRRNERQERSARLQGIIRRTLKNK